MTDKKRQIDWEKIELDYRAGIKTLRQIADEHGITHTSVRKKAEKEGWDRDLSARIEKKVDELVSKEIDKYDSSGFIYIVYFDDSDGKRFYKIGLSKNFLDRINSHQTSLPFKIKVACGYFVPNMRYEERALHSIFKDKHIRGEWYALDKDDLHIIKERVLL